MNHAEADNLIQKLRGRHWSATLTEAAPRCHVREYVEYPGGRSGWVSFQDHGSGNTWEEAFRDAGMLLECCQGEG